MKLKQMSILLFSSSLALVACDSCNESGSAPASNEDSVATPESAPQEGMTGEAESTAPADQGMQTPESTPPSDGSYGTDEGTPPTEVPAEESAPAVEGGEHQEVPPADVPAPEGSGN